MAKVYLERGISQQELEKGVEFEIDYEDHSSSDESFEDERFDDFKKEISNIEETLKYNSSQKFSDLKALMEPLTDDCQVYKKIIKWGCGKVIPEKSVVVMHYEGYFENQQQPFDSTRLRNKPYKFLLGDGNIIPGLEIGIRTMKVEEMSRFIVSSNYAYGEMGCPPRIPGGAEVLYEVEILNFFESKDVIEFEEMTPDEQKKAPFEKIVTVFHCEHQMGNDLFRKGLFKPAIARYRRMVKLLEDVSVADEEQDNKRKQYLLKLYMNLAQCYINIKNSKKAIIYADLAVKLDEENPKALYRMGTALQLSNEYDKAKYYLTKAKKSKPYEKAINIALCKLEEKQKQHKEWEKLFCGKMFCNESHNQQTNKTIQLPESKEFQNVIEAEIKRFLDSNEKELSFSSGYTEDQIEVVKHFAGLYGLAFISKIHFNNKIIKVAKRNVRPVNASNV